MRVLKGVESLTHIVCSAFPRAPVSSYQRRPHNFVDVHRWWQCHILYIFHQSAQLELGVKRFFDLSIITKFMNQLTRARTFFIGVWACHCYHICRCRFISAPFAIAFKVIRLFKFCSSRCWQVNLIDVRDSNFIPIEFRNVFNQSNRQLRALKYCNGIWLAWMIKNWCGEINSSTNGIQIIIEDVKTVDAKTTVDS